MRPAVTIIKKAKNNQQKSTKTAAEPNPFIKTASPLVPLFSPK